LALGTHTQFLSSRHLPRAERDALDAEARATRDKDPDGLAAGTALPPVSADAHGVWVHVPDVPDPDETERRRVAPVLQSVLELARDAGAGWVRLDEDAAPEPKRPIDRMEQVPARSRVHAHTRVQMCAGLGGRS
jgi:hypothetical protein